MRQAGVFFTGLKAARTLIAAPTAIITLLAVTAAAGDYHVSYLWHPDPAKAAAYKERLAALFGPDMARRLEVVRGREHFGVIYRRRGGLNSAEAVARAHSRILAARGLEPAVPVKASDWEPASGGAARPGAGEALEGEIEKYIATLRRSGSIKGDERTAWLVYDLSSGEKLVSINEDLPLDAASLIKPFIALAWLREAEAGRRPYGPAERQRMERMIRDSDNISASWFMRRLGGPSGLQRLLKENYGGIFRETRIVEYIPANGRTFLNRASAHDYSRFLYALWKDSVPGSAEIKRLMNLPNPDRLYTSTPGVPADTEVYDKTGTTSRLCGDMGVMVARRADGRSFPYIIVGLIEKSRSTRRYTKWMRERGDVIRRVSEMVYGEIAGMHGFSDHMPFNANAGGSADDDSS